ncbi:GAF domain-containing sensor histidine kinase [Fimbriiglobus ruber]|uniref:histidine kinase n=1 Tax=Fimbriiglobus ruber TaxID=1908690 RepID=A0A225D3H3_9BACT|nr:GAF domain-containing sensor histidine kinase [Fimbriiglobus ruber]OWK36140.1 Sensor histidine kinase [Fimbriiglobus ruber]
MKESVIDDVSAVAQIDAVPRILEVVCRATGMGFSAVARVTPSHWVACAVRDEIAFGLQAGGELVVGTTICDEIQRSGELVVIEDVDTNEAYSCHPTPKMYGFKSYISVPIRLHDGRFFGTLCAIDPRPARLKQTETVEMFKLFADLIAYHLDSQQRLMASEKALLGEREASQLREQFIAVLGHDLRNPLGAIRSGADLLTMLPKGEQANKVRDMIQRSVTRMTGLIDDVLDFARGRLGGGISLDRKVIDGLEGVLNQVVLELESANPERTVHRAIRISQPVDCDGSRLGQMLSNLLANAFTHGDPACPIWVRAGTSAGAFELSVTNQGPTIPPEIVGQLFQPFVRGAAKPGQQGLGLGLYIASEIARAHQGILKVESVEGTTRFLFQMPISSE